MVAPFLAFILDRELGIKVSNKGCTLSLDQIAFARRLSYFRKLKGISQIKMAEAINTSYRTYQRLESGESSIDLQSLFLITNKLNIEISDFFKLIEKEVQPTVTLPTEQFSRTFSQEDKLEQTVEKLTYFYQVLRRDNELIENLPYTRESLTEIYLSRDYLSHKSPMSLKLSDVTNFDVSTIRYWEDVVNLAGDIEYHLGYVQVDLGEKFGMRSSICLAKTISADPRHPKTKSIHCLLDDDLYVSHKDIMKIAEHFYEITKEKVHVHGHIG